MSTSPTSPVSSFRGSNAPQMIISLFELKMTITQQEIVNLHPDEKEQYLALQSIDKQTFPKMKKEWLSLPADSVYSIPFKCVFNVAAIERILQINSQKKQISKPSAVFFLFNAITAVYYQNEQLPPSSVHALIRSLTMCFSISACEGMATSLFKQVVNKTLESKNFEWNDELLRSIFHFIKINQSVDGTFYQTLTKLCAIGLELKSPDEKENSMQDVIFDFLFDQYDKKRTVVKKDDQTLMLNVLNPFIKQLHPKIFNILSAISLVAKCKLLNEIYEFFAEALEEKIIKHPIAIGDQKPVQNLPEIKSSNRLDQFTFIDKPVPSFPHSFRSLPPQILDNYDISIHFPDDIWDLISTLDDLLKKSSVEYADSFFSAFCQSIKMDNKEEVFYSNLIVILVLLKGNATPQRFSLYREILTTEKVFNPNYVVFSDSGLDPVINYLRKEIVILLADKDAEILMDIMKKENKLLFVEVLGRLLAKSFQMNMFLSSQSFLSDVIDTAFYLQELDMNQHTEEISLIRSVIFLFIAELSKFSAFLDASFITDFLNFLFEAEITDDILYILQSHFVYCKDGNNFIPLVEKLSLIFNICSNKMAAENANKDIRYGNLVCKIVQIFVESLKYSMRLIDPIYKLFPGILFNFKYNPSINFLNLILSLIYRISSWKEDFTLQIEDIITINEYMKQNSLNDHYWYIKFLSILTNCNIISPRDFKLNSFFFIERSQFLLPFLAIFGVAPGFESYLKKIMLNCGVSMYNARQCHDGCLDIVMLKFLAEEKEECTILHKGISISLKISKQGQNKIIIPLLISIISAKTSFSIASFLHKGCSKKKQVFLNIFSQVMEKCSLNYYPSTVIASLPSDTHVNNISIQTTNFSFTFWTKLDSARITRTRPEITLFSVTDRKNTLSLIYTKNNAMIIRYVDRAGAVTEYSFSIVIIEPTYSLEENTATANAWHFFGITFYILSGKQQATVFYNGYPISSNKPFIFPQFAFSKGNLNVQLGIVKTVDPQRCRELGYISDFHYYPIYLKPSDFYDIYTNCNQEFFNASHESSLINNEDKIDSSFYKSKTLLDMYEDPMILQQFMDTALQIADRKFLQNIKYILSTFPAVQKSFNMTEDILNCILMIKPQDASLYMMIYSIFEILTDESLIYEWLDTIIFNIPLWMNKNIDTLSKFTILCHWNTIILQNNSSASSYFKSKSRFSDVLVLFEQLFNNDEKECKSEYVTLLSRLASLNFTPNDSIACFNVTLSSSQKPYFSSYMQLLYNIAGCISPQVRKDMLVYMHAILQNDRSRNTLAILSTIHELANVDSAHESMVLARQLPKCCAIADIYPALIKHIRYFPNFFPLICCLSLKMSPEDKEKIAYALENLINNYPNAIKLTGLWYVWPIILAFNSEPKTSKCLFNFLALATNNSNEKISNIQNITHLITYASASLGINNQALLYLNHLASFVPNSESHVLTEVLNQLCYCIFFKISPNSHNSLLIKEMEKSPFQINFKYQVGSPFQQQELKNIEDLQTFTKNRLVPTIGFELTFDTDGNLSAFSSLQMALMLLDKLNNRSDYAEIIKKFAFKQKSQSKFNNTFDKMKRDYCDQFSKTITTLFKNIILSLDSSKTIVSNIPNTTFDQVNAKSHELLEANVLKELKPRPLTTNILEFYRSKACAPNYPSRIKKKLASRATKNHALPPPLKKLEFSMPDAKLINIRKTRTCDIQINKEYIRIVYYNENPKNSKPVLDKSKLCRHHLIKLSEVENVYYTDTSFEIVTKDCQNFLINISPQQFINVRKCFKDNQICEPTMTTHWRSNFEYIMYLNLASGRSFCNPKAYPIFPNILANYSDYMCRNISSVKLNRKNTTIDLKPLRWDASFFSVFGTNFSEILTNDLVIAPEFFYFFELFGDTKLPAWVPNNNRYDFIYKMRKLLESPSITKNLPGWIDCVWGKESFMSNQNHKQLFKTNHYAKYENPLRLNKGIFELSNAGLGNNKQISYASFHEKSLSLVCGKQIQYYFLSQPNSQLSVSKTKSFDLADDVSKYDFFLLGGKIAAFNKDTMTLSKYESIIETKTVCCTNPHFCECDKTFLYLEDQSTIRTELTSSSSSGFAFRSEDDILCFTASAKFSIVVFATVDNVVHIRSLPNGQADTQRKLRGIPRKILITEAWGFIVVLTSNEISILNINAEIIKTCPFQFEINYWSTFRSTSGFDYIIFRHKLSSFYAFEVMYPAVIKPICDQSDVIATHFLMDSETILLLTKSGKIVIQPIEIAQLFNS